MPHGHAYKGLSINDVMLEGEGGVQTAVMCDVWGVSLSIV